MLKFFIVKNVNLTMTLCFFVSILWYIFSPRKEQKNNVKMGGSNKFHKTNEYENSKSNAVHHFMDFRLYNNIKRS